MNYAHPDPLFLDFETQSAADIRECGGRLYASHPSTRILMLAAYWSGEYHLWIPNYVRGILTPDLWPHELQPKCPVHLYRDATCPDAFVEASRTRPIIAHNAYGFDRFIWERFVDSIKAEWLDSMLVAKSSNRPGSLDALGRQVLGRGKDLASKLMPELCTGVSYSALFHSWVYPLIKAGDLQAFSRYAISDVEILRRLWQSFDYLDVEDDVISAHDAINQRGVKVDRHLLSVIESVGNYSVSKAEDEISELTSGKINANNLRSTKQIHEWLLSYGVSITDDNGKPCLRKEIVKRWIDSPYVIDENLSAVREIPPLITQVLSLRLKALRITSAKVTRASSRAGVDDRIRDLHSYHQAGTGRWSSSGVQIHNLPRPIKGIDIERILDSIKAYQGNDAAELYAIVKSHTPPGLTVDDTLSALVRPCLLAEDGYVLCPCDFSQIEARCLAWIADEKKLLYAFAEGRDVYKEFGATLYGCTPAEVTGIKRDVSKVVVLGCIAEDTPIATDSGWIKIQDVTSDMLVWDGVEYVPHDGVIYQGEKKCLNLSSVWMTGNHEVLTHRGWLKANECINGNTLLPSGRYAKDGRYYLNIRANDERTTVADVSDANEKQVSYGRISEAENQNNVTLAQRNKAGILNHTDTYSQMIGTAQGYLLECRPSSHDVLTSGIISGSITAEEESQYSRNGFQTDAPSLPTSLHSQDGITRNSKLIESTTTETMNQGIYDSQHALYRIGTNVQRKKVYDILNCGLRQSFQAGPLIVHNCGYGLGADKFRVYAANAGIDLEKAEMTAEQAIESYRSAYTNIAGFKPDKLKSFRTNGVWHKLDAAVKTTVVQGIETSAGKCVFSMRGKDMACRLPSGRIVWYPDARMADIIPGYAYTLGLPLLPKATVVYQSPRGLKALYGGLMTENVCQAICRDLLATAMVRLESAQLPTVLHVHDEIVPEVKAERAFDSIKEIVRIMSDRPAWAHDFPIACEGFTSTRFTKAPFRDSWKCSTGKEPHK